MQGGVVYALAARRARDGTCEIGHAICTCTHTRTRTCNRRDEFS
jgi:hypothetical protein